MKSERLGHSSSSTSSLSGRNDDSSIVSLKALAARAESKVSTTRAATIEDSGLIDLKQLMANASPPASDAFPPVLAPNEAGLFAVPEATLSPYVHPASSLPQEPETNRPPNRTKWFVAATLVALAVVGTFGALHARSQRDPQLDAAPAVAAQPAVPEGQKFVEEKPPVEVAPPASTTVAEPLGAQTNSKSTLPSRQASVKPASRERAGQDASTIKNKADTTAAPSTPCDLMCQIQRASKDKKKP